MDDGMNDNGHYTIGGSAVPVNYSVFIEPDMKKFTFNGRVAIKLDIRSATDEITLNAKELSIKDVKIVCGESALPARFSLDSGRNEIRISLPKKVRGSAELIIEYAGIHNDKLYGFYRSRYFGGGRERYNLTTQFEAPNARAAFPCIDEPAFKATFELSLLIDKDLEAISNMPIKSTSVSKGKKLVVFHKTPRMSTYLLYIGVGKFSRLRGRAGEVKLDVVSFPGKEAYQKMPLDYGSRLFKDLQDYFVVKYPLPKLDLIAVSDFAVGAMENWGAITFRETALLGNEKETSLSGKQRIAEVIAHEMAHQWFGDLVTMEWWNDMWLNESFATFMEYKSVDRVFPKWKEMAKYYLDMIDEALVADGVTNSHPISVSVKTVGEIEQLFDNIGYEKGGSVLFMLENFVGPETFRRGLGRYLRQHAYSNAAKADLWGAIQAECRLAGKQLPVTEIMEDWINREGYPIVDVRSRGRGDFELEQRRFTISGAHLAGTWKIPINYVGENGKGSMIMDGRKATIRGAGGWIKLNHGQAGFYRVSYDDNTLYMLGSLARSGKLDDVECWGIENDLFARARAAEIPIEKYISFVGDNLGACGYPAIFSISAHLGWINRIGYGRDFAKGATELSMRFHGRILDRLGWNVDQDEDTIDTKLRSMAISSLGMLGDPTVLAKAEGLFDKSVSRGAALNPNIRAAVYTTICFNKPSAKNFRWLLNRYASDVPPDEKMRALQCLGMMGSEPLAKRALDVALSKDVRLQDSISIPSAMGANPIATRTYCEWAMRNWKLFMSKLDPSSHMLRRYVSLFGGSSNLRDLESYRRFFADKRNVRDDIALEIKQTEERISANIKFIKRNSQN